MAVWNEDVEDQLNIKIKSQYKETLSLVGFTGVPLINGAFFTCYVGAEHSVHSEQAVHSVFTLTRQNA